MSATLPNLEILTDNRLEAVNLIKDREKYFSHPVFAKRVIPNYELLQEEITLELLADVYKRQGQLCSGGGDLSDCE